MLMTELWLVRHGETDWNKAGRYQGQSDIPLNATGLEQARISAATLAHSGRTFTAIYSSPLSRAAQTAAAAAQLLGLPVRSEPRLREIHQGAWQGMNYQQIVTEFKELMDETEADPITRRAPGGESIGEVAERMAAAADEIANAHPHQSVLVFSHGLALATLVCQARGISLKAVYDHIPNNGHAEVVEWPRSLK